MLIIGTFDRNYGRSIEDQPEHILTNRKRLQSKEYGEYSEAAEKD